MNLVATNSSQTKCTDPITFIEKDMERVNFPHFDAIIIKVNLRGVEMRRLLVDNGSYCDILCLGAFMKMGINSSCLKPCAGAL